MVKANPETIILKGPFEMNEAIAGGAITPGHLVNLNSAGALVVQATADRRPPAQFALEYELEGQGITDAYASSDRVKYAVVRPGAEVYALVAAGEAAIVIGARLTAGPAGTVANSAAANDDFAIALEAVDNSGGGAAVRIKIRIV